MLDQLLLVRHGDPLDGDLIVALVVDDAGLEFRVMPSKERFIAKTFGNVAQFALAKSLLDVAVTLKTLLNAISHDQEVVCNVFLVAVPTERHFPCDFRDAADIDMIFDIVVTAFARFIGDIRESPTRVAFLTVIRNADVITTDRTYTPGVATD